MKNSRVCLSAPSWHKAIKQCRAVFVRKQHKQHINSINRGLGFHCRAVFVRKQHNEPQTSNKLEKARTSGNPDQEVSGLAH